MKFYHFSATLLLRAAEKTRKTLGLRASPWLHPSSSQWLLHRSDVIQSHDPRVFLSFFKQIKISVTASKILPAHCHDLARAGLVACAAGVAHVLPHARPGQEVKGPGCLVPGGVGVVCKAGVVLLQYQAVSGCGGAHSGRRRPDAAVLQSCRRPRGSGALTAVQATS